MKEFGQFIRNQGVVGLAVGFILGGAISKTVTSLVTDIINPLLGIVLGAAGNLSNYYLTVGKAKIAWGNFLSNVIDFLVISLVVYIAVKILRLENLYKKS